MINSVVTKKEVVERLRANASLVHELGVKRIGLFGSFVRDEATLDSDVDVLVEFELGQKSFNRFMELVSMLEELFQRRVEVVTTEALSPHVGPRILDSVEYVTKAA